VVIIWRFTGSRFLSEVAERRAQVLVAAQFFILAPFIAYEGVEKLVTGGDIETGWLGIGLTIATLAICQPLGFANRRLGAKLGSRAAVGEGYRISSAATWPSPCSSACSPTRCSVSGGSIGGGARDRWRRRAGGTQGIAWRTCGCARC
jgi:hypothetical protein